MKRPCLAERVILGGAGGRVVIGALKASGRARSGATTGVHIVCLRSRIPLRECPAGSRSANGGALNILRCMRVSDFGRDVEEQVESRRRCHRQFKGIRYDFRA